MPTPINQTILNLVGVSIPTALTKNRKQYFVFALNDVKLKHIKSDFDRRFISIHNNISWVKYIWILIPPNHGSIESIMHVESIVDYFMHLKWISGVHFIVKAYWELFTNINTKKKINWLAYCSISSSKWFLNCWNVKIKILF